MNIKINLKFLDFAYTQDFDAMSFSYGKTLGKLYTAIKLVNEIFKSWKKKSGPVTLTKKKLTVEDCDKYIRFVCLFGCWLFVFEQRKGS